jgi:hypothetical protein
MSKKLTMGAVDGIIKRKKVDFVAVERFVMPQQYKSISYMREV